jgi:hypothetical protein
MSKGEPEITAVTGSNERSGSKQETMRKQSEMPNGQPKPGGTGNLAERRHPKGWNAGSG